MQDFLEVAGPLTERVRSICLDFPDTMEKLSHAEPTWFVKGKQYANMDTNHHNSGHIAVHCAAPSGAQETLIAANAKRFFRPPYVGGRGWIGIRLDDEDVDWGEVATLLADAVASVRSPARR
jgi:hypothetical protein